MRILAIETSCDETAVALLECNEGGAYTVHGEQMHSQVDIHRDYGGVYPSVAKREHQKSLPLLTHRLLSDLHCLEDDASVTLNEDTQQICEREPEMLQSIERLFSGKRGITIDAIAVTQGPGLAPALWTGVNFARTLSLLWDIPVIPINHMIGHIAAALIDEKKIITPAYPALALLVSGGHTELVLASQQNTFEKIGSTVDDAAGEAFDKVARLLGLPYPGGPEISKLAQTARDRNLPQPTSFPRPMLRDGTLNFSYAGLKTAVRLYIEKKKAETEPTIEKDEVAAIAREFEEAVVETLITKTRDAIEQHAPASFILGGGVSANAHLRKEITDLLERYPDIQLYLPRAELSTDNAVMIGLAACSLTHNQTSAETLRADSALSFN